MLSEFRMIQERRATDFEAPKLRKGRLPVGMLHMQITCRLAKQLQLPDWSFNDSEALSWKIEIQ